MQRYSILLMDADDTLFDFGRAEHEAIKNTLIRFSIEPTDETIAAYVRINKECWRALERGELDKLSLRHVRFERLCRELGVDADAVEMGEFYLADLATHAFLIDGAAELCRELSKDFEIYIITNGIKSVQTGRMARSGLAPYIKKCFISEDIGYEKPAPEYFGAVAAEIEGFDSARALVIGDSLTSDIAGGRNAGIDTCHYDPHGRAAEGMTYSVRGYDELRALLYMPKYTDMLSENCIKYEENTRLSEHSSFKVGGPAALGVFPESTEEIVKAVRLARECKIKYTVIGNGSNVVFADRGYLGAVIFTSGAKSIEINGNTVKAECGASFTHLAAFAGKASLAGLEFAYGIPGTVGGAVYMNAGAYGGEVKDALRTSLCYDAASGEILEIREHAFSYRTSIYAKSPSLTVLEATFELASGDADEIKTKMDELMEKRRDKQPLEFPSAGSTFKRPEGHFAGKLIEDAGLKGYTVGGAQVSEKHAGFVINRGGATANDILELVEHIKKVVSSQFGVMLECEIKYIY